REVEDGSREAILDYLIDQDITLRDDGVSVKWFAERFGVSTLRSPEMFDLFWQRQPIDLELQHYHMTLEEELWKQGVPFTAAIEEVHATYAGFHGYARKWLNENPDLAKTLTNRLGYWYFPKSIEWPSIIKRGEQALLSFVWENHGVAPAYHKYELELKLENIQDETMSWKHHLENSDNRNWMPSRMNWERFRVDIPSTLDAGTYKLGVRIVSKSSLGMRNVELGLKDEVRDHEGYYFIAQLNIN
ncbi:MAG: DUF4832 domain-containing protein, partial [Gorillibacterium sp.]|nr:DUF4832 domain-containing protein [Gorillibacterium sp.]